MARVDAGTGRLTQYKSFWHVYLREHSRKATRQAHYIGSTLALACLLVALLTQSWLPLLLVPLCGYGPAWVGHFFIERNQPLTFRYPIWSLISDFRMYGLWLTGRLHPHLKAAHVPLARC